MSYLLDTDIISLAHKKFLPVSLVRWLAENEADCFISVVTVAEMRHGVENAPAGHREELAADVAKTETDYAEAMEAIDLTVLVEWKKIFAHLKRIKRTIACEDALLAAQCLAAGHVLVTNNTAHFKILEPLGLKVINPLA